MQNLESLLDEILSLSPDAVAKLAVSSVDDNKISLAKIVGSLLYEFGNQMFMVEAWLNTPHPYLDHMTPKASLSYGLNPLETLIYCMKTGQPW